MSGTEVHRKSYNCSVSTHLYGLAILRSLNIIIRFILCAFLFICIGSGNRYKVSMNIVYKYYNIARC